MPLHRIQRWTGQYFRPASLWEVGVCVIVDHGKADRRCEWLRQKEEEYLGWQIALDKMEEDEDTSSGRADMGDSESGEQAGVSDQGDVHRAGHDINTDDAGNAAKEFDMDDMMNALLEEDARRAHGGDEELDGADDGSDDVHGLPAEPIDHPTPPMSDGNGNVYVLIVHTNGLHSLPYIQCGCGGPQERISGAIGKRLMPASFKVFKTFFTFDVLDDFRLANLECKTSAYQYYQLLRRKTEPLAPHSVPERYAELRRLSRCWRWLKKLKWGGHLTARDRDGERMDNVRTAELSVFCPSCPQPGVNLPDNWKDDSNRWETLSKQWHSCSPLPGRWVYRRTLMADGNFKADHIRQSTGDKDIWLSAGSSMLPHRGEYGDFLQRAENIKTVSIGHGDRPPTQFLRRKRRARIAFVPLKTP